MVILAWFGWVTGVRRRPKGRTFGGRADGGTCGCGCTFDRRPRVAPAAACELAQFTGTPEYFHRLRHDRVGPSSARVVPRAFDDLTDEVVRLSAVDIEHPWPEPPASAPPKSVAAQRDS